MDFMMSRFESCHLHWESTLSTLSWEDVYPDTSNEAIQWKAGIIIMEIIEEIVKAKKSYLEETGKEFKIPITTKEYIKDMHMFFWRAARNIDEES